MIQISHQAIESLLCSIGFLRGILNLSTLELRSRLYQRLRTFSAAPV
jgi:hypothetical protein